MQRFRLRLRPYSAQLRQALIAAALAAVWVAGVAEMLAAHRRPEPLRQVSAVAQLVVLGASAVVEAVSVPEGHP